MNKEYILKEIDRIAKENDGVPLGQNKFAKETGIRKSDWLGKYWTKWGDALIEAGYPPNTLQTAYDEKALIEQVLSFIREIGKFPTPAEFYLKARNTETFPTYNTFRRRLGKKSELINKLLVYCESKPEYSDITEICRRVAIT